MKTVTIGLTNIHFHYSELNGIIGTAVLSFATTEIQWTPLHSTSTCTSTSFKIISWRNILLCRHNREVEQWKKYSLCITK